MAFISNKLTLKPLKKPPKIPKKPMNYLAVAPHSFNLTQKPIKHPVTNLKSNEIP